MKLAVNYSHEAAELLRERRIDMDFFKCPDWPHMIAEAEPLKPVAVHFDLNAGSGRLHETDWQRVETIRTQTHTPFVNVHIDPPLADFPGLDLAHPSPAERSQLIARIVHDLDAVCARFGADNVIAENAPYHAAYGHVVSTAVEPQVLSESILSAGCGLLLDISHARITAHYLGLDAWEYLDQLPLQALAEMHFAGIHSLNGQLEDHLSILPADLAFLDDVLQRMRNGDLPSPWMMAFEYGGVGGPFTWRSEIQVLAEQVPVLFDRLR